MENEKIKIGRVTTRMENMLGISLSAGNAIYASEDFLNEASIKYKDKVNAYLLFLEETIKKPHFIASKNGTLYFLKFCGRKIHPFLVKIKKKGKPRLLFVDETCFLSWQGMEKISSNMEFLSF